MGAADADPATRHNASVAADSVRLFPIIEYSLPFGDPSCCPTSNADPPFLGITGSDSRTQDLDDGDSAARSREPFSPSHKALPTGRRDWTHTPSLQLRRGRYGRSGCPEHPSQLGSHSRDRGGDQASHCAAALPHGVLSQPSLFHGPLALSEHAHLPCNCDGAVNAGNEPASIRCALRKGQAPRAFSGCLLGSDRAPNAPPDHAGSTLKFGDFLRCVPSRAAEPWPQP